MTARLKDKVALVTGGAAGLGMAIAQRLSQEGARVVITDISTDRGAAAARAHDLDFLQQDVSDEASWDAIVGEVEARFGALHILVNNAGILGPLDAATPENTTLDSWRQMFAVNVEGVFLGCRAAISAMRRARGGAIVNLSSMADKLATPNTTAYGASKAAVRHLTRSVAQYCAEQKIGVRCNSVHPGMVLTDMLKDGLTRLAEQRGVSFDEVAAKSSGKIPLGGFTLPEDIAATVAFLVSDDARHMTGCALRVDGGLINCNTFKGG